MRLEEEGEMLSFLSASCFCQYHLSNTTSFQQEQLLSEAAVVDSRQRQFSDILSLGEPALLCTFRRVQVWGSLHHTSLPSGEQEALSLLHPSGS